MQRHRSEEHTSELQSLRHLVCRLLLEKKKKKKNNKTDKRLTRRSALPRPHRAWGVSGGGARCKLMVSDALASSCSLFFSFFFNCAAPPGFFPFSPPSPFPN